MTISRQEARSIIQVSHGFLCVYVVLLTHWRALMNNIGTPTHQPHIPHQSWDWCPKTLSFQSIKLFFQLRFLQILNHERRLQTPVLVSFHNQVKSYRVDWQSFNQSNLRLALPQVRSLCFAPFMNFSNLLLTPRLAMTCG